MKKKAVFCLLVSLIAGLLFYYFRESTSTFTGFKLEELPPKFSESSYYKDYHLANKFVIYVDFSKSAKNRRLWVVDKGTVIATSYTSHGKKSAALIDILPPRRFSNKIGSHQSSLGIFSIRILINTMSKVTHTCSCLEYNKNGNCKHWRKSFILKGLIKGLNDNAQDRGILIHTAKYVSENTWAGNSEGCFVVSPEIFELLQSKLTHVKINYYLVALN